MRRKPNLYKRNQKCSHGIDCKQNKIRTSCQQQPQGPWSTTLLRSNSNFDIRVWDEMWNWIARLRLYSIVPKLNQAHRDEDIVIRRENRRVVNGMYGRWCAMCGTASWHAFFRFSEIEHYKHEIWHISTFRTWNMEFRFVITWGSLMSFGWDWQIFCKFRRR